MNCALVIEWRFLNEENEFTCVPCLTISLQEATVQEQVKRRIYSDLASLIFPMGQVLKRN